MKYELRYISEMDPYLIYNQCGPGSAGPVGWDEETIKKREVAAERYITAMNKKQGFYKKIEASVLKIGFRNPILIRCGWCPPKIICRLPPKMQKNLNKILVCDSNGGSRLWVAQNHNMKIPCIVQDYTGRFDNEELIPPHTEDILNYFTDKPKKVAINAQGIGVHDLPQIHMQDNN